MTTLPKPEAAGPTYGAYHATEPRPGKKRRSASAPSSPMKTAKAAIWCWKRSPSPLTAASSCARPRQAILEASDGEVAGRAA